MALAQTTHPDQAASGPAAGRERPPSARSHLLTILGEFVLPAGGLVWTSALVDGLGAMGVEEKAARQAVARSAERGLLDGERIGRLTRWRLTPAAAALLTEGTERIYSFHHRPRAWDGRWVLVFLSVPEARRDLRYQLRTRLAWAGFGPLGSGVWISPWTERQAEAERIIDDLGLRPAARSFVGIPGSIGEPADLVAQAWDLVAIDHDYQQFIARHGGRAPKGGEAAFRALTTLVHEWRRLPFRDPDLPSELLPRPWSGDRAGTLFHRQHDRWKPAAVAWWAERCGTATTR